ncbi:hypothetical protein AQJ27_35560 [Streptomyces olivochromogenes]|uniref:Uncharacterized protein n=1 Tax=Streptomyces olivochromogenes TaxID=1963 RepID=A0A250VKC1_STROL|nr:hypothetical protein AQJ27_35560 [Streptomyces olivochromogenes]GAX54591.1 hypothetical protein SO3561_06143 [Streptomyces olivochromogenes]
MCAEEIDLAVQYGKRVIPLFHRPVPRQDMPKALAAHHRTEGGDLDRAECERAATQRAAARQEPQERQALAGREHRGRAPTPTELHREYLARGRAAAHQTHSRKLATRAEDALKDQLALGLLLGREAADEQPTVEAGRALLTAPRTRPLMVRFLDALAGVPAGDRGSR